MPKHYQFDLLSRLVATAIGTFAPETAIRYLFRRKALAHYTAARPDGPNKGWRPTNSSADEIMKRDRVVLLARARDLERNSSHIFGAVNKICNNVIFTGIFPQARLRTPQGKLDKVRNDKIENEWKDWAEESGYYEKQELILRHLWIDGEVLQHRFFDEDLYKKGLCPLGLEILETDFLDHSLNADLGNGNIVKAGIEYSKQGKPVAYHIFMEHPGESSTSIGFNKTRRIPASEINHIYHPRRASQSRGISWLSSIILEMRDFAEYQSSERIAARLASAFGIFVESPYPEHQLNNPLFQDLQQEGTDGRKIPDYIEPGRIDTLPPGTKISVAQYNRPGTTYEPFTKASLKGASTGTGISYENFSNDYAESSYSSARQAILEERRGYRKIQAFLNRRANRWVWKAWIEYRQISQPLDDMPDRVPVQWQNPGWPWIDPAKDARGAQIELEMMITNRRRLAAERGLDWDEEVEEYAEEMEILREKRLNETKQG